MDKLYSVGTWDAEAQGYTPQIGVDRSFNITRGELRRALKRLRELGYSAHRLRDEGGDGHYDNDTDVLVERTDGESETKILERWKR
jgi:hypothetical protein